MKDKLYMFIRTKTGKGICVVLIVFVLATSAYGTAVQAVNFPMLMTMVQKMVTEAITDKIKSVWDESDSCSKSERSLCYLRRHTPRCTLSTPASAPPRCLDIISDLEQELTASI